MHFDFSQILAKLGPNYAFQIANAARSPNEYLFATLLPEIKKPTYDAKSGNMTVRSTMAGLVGMDSPYPPTGVVEASTFSEQVAKIANYVQLSEAALRQLQQIAASRSAAGQTPLDMAQEVLNFLDKVIIQAHMDTAEYLRAEALVYGAISWTFNQKTLAVDYGVSGLGNLLTNRTGNDAYLGSTSKFWADIAAMRTKLKGEIRTIIAHPDTIELILANSVNAIRVNSLQAGVYNLTKYTTVGGNTVPSSDARETITLVAYNREGEVLDPTNPGTTIKVPFMPRGRLLGVGNNATTGYQPGMGSTVDPLAEQALGYTHLAPTVEGGNAMGRWAQLFTPEHLPMQLHGRGVTNLLPIIEAPQKIVVASTDMT